MLLSPKYGAPPQIRSTASLIQRLTAVCREADPQCKIIYVWLLRLHIHNSTPLAQQMHKYPKAQTNQITKMLLINIVQPKSMKKVSEALFEIHY